MKTITRRNLFYIIFAILILYVSVVLLAVDDANAYAETESAPFTIIGETSGKEYCSGDYTNERVTITITDSRYSRIYFKTPTGTSYTYTKSGKYTTGISNGQYKFYLSSEYGEQGQEFSIFFDNKAPIGCLYSNGQIIENGNYAYDNLYYLATDEVSGIAKLFYKTPLSEDYQEYLSDMVINVTSESGWYSFYAIDNCQNVSEVKTIFFKFDKNTVQGKWVSCGEYLLNNGYTNQPLSFEFDEKEYTAKMSYNGSDYANYSSGQIYTEDGDYSIVLLNLDNQEYKFYAHIDTVPPTGQLYANYLPIDSCLHTKFPCYLTWDGDSVATVNGTAYTKNSVLSQDGTYNFVLSDLAGNQSIYIITIDTLEPNYNVNKLNSFQRELSVWYIVRIEGADYSFATYNEALTFACEKEFEKEVTVLYLDKIDDFNQHHLVAGNTDINTGEYWLYKSKTNPDILLYYFDKMLLNEAISYYAKDFVSDKNHFKYDGNNNYGITAESMSDNWFYIDGSPVPFVNNFVFDCVDSLELFAELADGSGTRIQLEYGSNFNEQITIGGLYKITEIDAAENVTIYYCYFDTLPPAINVTANIYGDTEPVELVVSKDSLQGIAAYFYESFEIKEIVDADRWTVITIENNGNKRYFTYGEDLPCLALGGEYKLTVYDRFNNTYSFTVYIVGNPATISFKNNNDDSTFTVSIALEQSFDTIVSLEIRRDDKILSGVSTDKLFYEFESAGVYTVRLQDNFGRVVTANYSFKIFLDTVAPTIALRGVMNGGKTEKSVVIDNLSEQANVEVYKDGQLIEYNLGDELSQHGEYVVVITDLANNVSTYCFTIEHNLNLSSILIIVLSILILLSAVIAVILRRKIGIFGKRKNLKSDSNSEKKD